MVKRFLLITTVIVAIFFLSFGIWLILELILDANASNRALLIVTLCFLLSWLILIVVATFVFKFVLRDSYSIKKSFLNFLDKSARKNKLGVLVLNPERRIIWISSFVKERLGNSILNKPLLKVFPELLESDNLGSDFVVVHRMFAKTKQEIIYYLEKDKDAKTISIKDITFEESVLKNYRDERLAVVEIEIDNYQLYQSILSEEEIFLIESDVVALLEELVKTYNVAYRQYAKGKFLILADYEAITQMMKVEFSFVDKLNNDRRINTVRISVSLGIAKGFTKINELINVAKRALRQSQSRGGDQVTIYEKDKKPIFFGSKSEISLDYSRTKIKEVTRIFEARLLSRDIETVIVYGHKLADLDALGSAYAIAWVAKQYGKKAYIQNVEYDNTTKKAINKYLQSRSDLFIKPAAATALAGAKTMVVLVDTAEKTRIENENAFVKIDPLNIFVFDHHRVSENVTYCPLANQYVETTASSASEIVTEVLSFLEKDLPYDKVVTQMLLNGIYLDTNKFQKTTSAKTFAAAAMLETLGASTSESVELLKVSEETNIIIKELLLNVQEIKEGFFLTKANQEISEDTVSIAADEMLRISGRRAVFVIAKVPNQNLYKMSARGIKTNVQIIAEAVGGGGHYASAAALSNESFEKFVDNIIQAIVSVKSNESNLDQR